MVEINITSKNGVKLKDVVKAKAINFPEARRLATVNNWHGTMSDGHKTIPLRLE